MSRSFKKATITMTKKVDKLARKALRRRVKQQLSQIDTDNLDDKDLVIIEADERDLGKEEYGTKMGLEFESLKKCISGEYAPTEEEHKE